MRGVPIYRGQPPATNARICSLDALIIEVEYSGHRDLKDRYLDTLLSDGYT